MALALMVGATLATGAMAEDKYPNKPITVVVAWDAGGASDVVVRALQPALARELGTDLVIRNVPGAAGTIGTAEAARAKPDGYTILIGPAGPIAIQPLMRKLPYTADSFEDVARISMAPTLMMVPSSSSFKSVADVVRAAQEKPGEIRFGSVGAGSLPHLAVLAFEKSAGIKVKHVPFQGSANAMKGLLGGFVEVFNDQSQLAPKYELVGLAAWSPERLKDFPNVPTLKELGYDLDLSNWIGVFAPKGTPQPIVDKLSAATKAALEDKSTLQTLDRLQVTPAWQSPADFAAFVTGNVNLSRDLLQDAGLVKQN